MRRIFHLLLFTLLPAIHCLADDPVLQLVNLSPDPAMTLVKVELGDSVVMDSIPFNEGTAYLAVAAGAGQTLRFSSYTDTAAVFELDGLELLDDRMYQSIFYGVMDDADYFPNPDGRSLLFDAAFAEVDTTGLSAGSIRTNFFHAVGDAVGLDVADLLFEYIVDNMFFGEYSSTSTDLPANLRSLFFTSSDSVTVISSRSIDLGAVSGNTITIFLSGFIVPNDNNNGPVLEFYGIDQAGNIHELGFVLSTPLEEILSDLRVYPNPASDHLSLDFYYDGNETLDLRFTDLAGRTYKEDRLRIYPGSNDLLITLPELSNGLYLLSLSDGRQVRSIPVVIVR